jgi:hypothetical protein
MVYYLSSFYDNGTFEIDFKKMDPTGMQLESMAAAGKARRTIPVFP